MLRNAKFTPMDIIPRITFEGIYSRCALYRQKFTVIIAHWAPKTSDLVVKAYTDGSYHCYMSYMHEKSTPIFFPNSIRRT